MSKTTRGSFHRFNIFRACVFGPIYKKATKHLDHTRRQQVFDNMDRLCTSSGVKKEATRWKVEGELG